MQLYQTPAVFESYYVPDLYAHASGFQSCIVFTGHTIICSNDHFQDGYGGGT
ncbi:MAG: hypothetical protein M3126_07820 [Candidatus Eremiobacteraeota bacterium]|nr:hypothetical protein [Candidatus Eremiobacteraeota bacterium]